MRRIELRRGVEPLEMKGDSRVLAGVRERQATKASPSGWGARIAADGRSERGAAITGLTMDERDCVLLRALRDGAATGCSRVLLRRGIHAGRSGPWRSRSLGRC